MLRNKLVVNFMMVFISRIGSSALYFIASVILMKKFTTEQYGEFSYWMAIVAVVPFFVSLGIDNSYISIASKMSNDSEESYCSISLYFYKLKIYIISSLLLLFFVYNIFFPSLLIFVVLLIGVIMGTLEALRAPFQAKQEFVYIFFTVPVRNFLFVVLCFVFIVPQIKPTMEEAVYLLLYSSVGGLLFSIILSKDKIIRCVKAKCQKYPELLNISKWLFLNNLLIAIMTRLEIFFLKYYTTNSVVSEAELGYYSGAFSLCMVFPLITNSLSKVLLPEVAGFSSYYEIKNYSKKIVKSAPLIILVVALSFLLLSFSLKLFFAEKYSSSIPFVGFILGGMTLTFFTNNLQLVFYRVNKMHVLFKIGIIQFAFDVAANFILIKHFGLYGAAYSLLVVRVIGILLTIIFVGKYIKELDYDNKDFE